MGSVFSRMISLMAGRVAAVVFTGLLAVSVQAAEPPQLFEAEVAIPSQAPGLRAGAFKKTLSEVLVRVAGDNAVLTSAPGQALLADAPGLVQQYRYFTEPGSEPPQLKLRVRFDGKAIRSALQQQGLSYWGSERPDTLVWLAVEDRGQRYIVAADDDNEVRKALDRAAQQRGVPVVFPLMDLEDQSQVRFSDIQGGFFENVIKGSGRYNPQAVLIGRLNRSPSGGWSSQWDLSVAGSTKTWRDSRAQLDALLQQGMEDTADALASQFSVAGSGLGADTVNISIEGVNSLAAYDRVNKYLASLTSVNGLQVVQVNGATLQVALQLNGSLRDLSRTVSIGSVIEPMPGGMEGSYRVRW